MRRTVASLLVSARHNRRENSCATGPLTGIGPAASWCLTAGLPGVDNEAPSPAAFTNEAQVIAREGLAPVALHALRHEPNYTSTWAFKEFRRATGFAEMRAMAAASAGTNYLAALDELGVASTIVKGPAVARFHPAGWPRAYVDIDVVVTTDTFALATEQALAMGFHFSDRAVPQWEWFNTVCREGANLHSDAGGNVDLHHHISPWALGVGLPASDLIHRSSSMPLCGQEVKVAAPEDLIVVSALHVLNDLWKATAGLNSWRDVLVLISVLGQDGARQAFARANLLGLFDLMEAHLAETLPSAGLTPTATPAEISASVRFHLASLGWTRSRWPTKLRLAWATRLPPKNAVAYLAGVAVPSRAYIHERHGSYGHYWSQGLKEIWTTRQGSDHRMSTVADAPQP